MAVIAVAAVLVASLIFWSLSRYIHPTGPEHRKELISLLFQVTGGVIVMVGVYFTWQELKTSREGQITDRFTRAIDQLGKSDDQENSKDSKSKPAQVHQQKNLAIRLGGIYALERISRDSDRDHPAIMEILIAYVRQNSPWGIEMESAQSTDYGIPQDIQAVLTVIGRRKFTYQKGETQRHDLSGTNLRWAVLNGANLNGMIMKSVRLEHARLKKAELVDADLYDARFGETFLDGAYLNKANLKGANFFKATVTEADFTGADLSGADLRGAIGLTQQQLDAAKTDASTQTDGNLKPRGKP